MTSYLLKARMGTIQVINGIFHVVDVQQSAFEAINVYYIFGENFLLLIAYILVAYKKIIIIF